MPDRNTFEKAMSLLGAGHFRSKSTKFVIILLLIFIIYQYHKIFKENCIVPIECTKKYLKIVIDDLFLGNARKARRHEPGSYQDGGCWYGTR